ncbi:PIG-L family deacetylase [Aurantiacibacter spongiae]|uniref:PIG-L family deacetylase n=2 Tax=Aurantiacibacter spongiae TaxID=2488860 RepID=A0A3N5D126_9SPHN|nr:PIG-L family deacetylase [Aurantiacibacter spongiae]
MRTIAVVAPHPDDEILGCGGTISRFVAEGRSVHVVIVTRGRPPKFPEDLVNRVRAETQAAHDLLGIHATHHLDLPAAELDTLPQAELNATVGKALGAIRPDALFVPFNGDIHADHRACFDAAMVYARPRDGDCPRLVLAYETLSETNWWAPGLTPGFLPNVTIDISGHLEAKLEAFRCFASQVKDFPDERSFETIRALAKLRGSTVFCEAGEAFALVRQII